MGHLTLILGGARSGKSTYAQKLATQLGGKTLYIATARALDDEMVDRIAIHQQERPQDWNTLELPENITSVLLQQPIQAETILLDCVTMLVTNLLMGTIVDEDRPDEAAATTAVENELAEILRAIRQSQATWIIVSNEVGLGLVPPYPLGRLYRDLLGRANQRLAATADEVYWMVAGIPVPIHTFRT